MTGTGLARPLGLPPNGLPKNTRARAAKDQGIYVALLDLIDATPIQLFRREGYGLLVTHTGDARRASACSSRCPKIRWRATSGSCGRVSFDDVCAGAKTVVRKRLPMHLAPWICGAGTLIATGINSQGFAPEAYTVTLEEGYAQAARSWTEDQRDVRFDMVATPSASTISRCRSVM